MKRSRALWLGGGAVAVLGLLGLVVAVATVLSPGTDRNRRPVRIQESYDRVRHSAGHSVHLATRDVACSDCHDVDGERFSRPTAAVCATCHDDHPEQIHAATSLGRADTDCLACHDFIDDPTVRPWGCLGCHDQDRGFARAIEVHDEAPCGACHRPHDSPTLVPRSCGDAGCHDIAEVVHGKERIDGQRCLDCHQVHDARRAAAARCADCHLDGQPRVSPAAIASGHSCSSCHTDHRFTRAATRSCASCHQRKPTLAAATVRAHARCESCHAPHAPRARGDRSCKGCHARVVPDHGDAPSCLGCHPVHDLSGPGTALACSSCHDDFAGDVAHGGKQSCASCHPAHQFGSRPPAPRSCAGCHRSEVELARGTGHADCARCHGDDAVHRPRKSLGCATCHRQQAVTAPRGHRDCSDCHDSHRGAVGAEPACKSCHQDRARGNHAGIAGGCQSCHRAHGPGGPAAPPTCASCHPTAALPALHAVPRHQQCASCHGAHEQRPRADRATCLGCHRDQKDHEPTATRCDGCHLFGFGGDGPKF